METNNETGKITQATASAAKASAPASNKVLIGAIAVLTAVVIGATAVIVDAIRRDDGGVQQPANNGLTIDYAQDARVFLDQNALQAAMDEALKNARDRNVALRYQNDAVSTDGVNFECHIMNSSGNIYDMFLNICADAEMTDQLFLSKLLRPGTGFERITLDRALEKGDHTVYVAVSLVDTDETGAQVIKAQVIHTMDFHVT